MEEDPNLTEEKAGDEEFNDLMELLLEKEPLVEHLDKSKEYMESRIQKMESDIIKSIQNEWKDYLADLILKQK